MPLEWSTAKAPQGPVFLFGTQGAFLGSRIVVKVNIHSSNRCSSDSKAGVLFCELHSKGWPNQNMERVARLRSFESLESFFAAYDESDRVGRGGVPHFGLPSLFPSVAPLCAFCIRRTGAPHIC